MTEYKYLKDMSKGYVYNDKIIKFRLSPNQNPSIAFKLGKSAFSEEGYSLNEDIYKYLVEKGQLVVEKSDSISFYNWDISYLESILENISINKKILVFDENRTYDEDSTILLKNSKKGDVTMFFSRSKEPRYREQYWVILEGVDADGNHHSHEEIISKKDFEGGYFTSLYNLLQYKDWVGDYCDKYINISCTNLSDCEAIEGYDVIYFDENGVGYEVTI